MKPAFSRGRTQRSRFSFVLRKDGTGVTAVLALAVVLAAPALARSQTFTVLTSFQAGGFEPNSTLVRDQEGNLYGTAYYGGNVSDTCGGSCGTLFRLDKHGKQTALHKFSGPDGDYAPARLLRDGEEIFLEPALARFSCWMPSAMKGTFTLKLSNMLGTHGKGGEPSRPPS